MYLQDCPYLYHIQLASVSSLRICQSMKSLYRGRSYEACDLENLAIACPAKNPDLE